MAETAIQSTYPDDVAHCYGCGRLNEAGHQLQSIPNGEGTQARFTPRPEHTAIPGYVYGGLIASLIDCHGTGTASWAARTADDPAPRFVTGTLEVKYVAPTPLGPELVLDATVAEKSARKVVVEVTVKAEGTVTAKGRVVAVRMPDSMIAKS